MVSIKELQKHAVIDTKTGCWIWNGRDRNTYHRIRGKAVHRLAYLAAVGPIPTGLLICHHCDTPACFNPAHLFAGTHLDNMEDAKAKGRLKGGRVEKEQSRIRLLARLHRKHAPYYSSIRITTYNKIVDALPITK